MRLNSLHVVAVMFGCLGAIGLIAVARGQGGGGESDCVTNVQKVVAGLQLYVQDWDDVFPKMKTADEFKAALTPYMGGPQPFNCPVTNLPYKPNPDLSEVTLASIPDFSTKWVMRDAKPHPDGTSTIGFLDGTVELGGVVQGDPNALCVQNVRRLTLGLSMYVEDFDEKFPPMKDPKRFVKLLYPYVRSHRAFTCPDTGLLYQPNALLSRLSYTQIADPSTTVALQDAKPHEDGLLTVGFLDQHVERGGVVQGYPEQSCVQKVGQLVLGVQMYTQDYDETLPPVRTMRNVDLFKQAILTYVHNDQLFFCPVTQLPYISNASLGGKSLGMIPDWSVVPVVRDAKHHPDGKSTVGYLDGHVEQGGIEQGDPTYLTGAHARTLMIALQEYLQDYSGALPPMKTLAQFKAALMPYVHSSQVFTCPYTHKTFKINTALNGHYLTDFSNPAAIVVIQDPGPERDGRPTIGYLDGHVEPQRGAPINW